MFNNIKFLAGANKYQVLPEKSSPEIAFWGRSNVGKSSTINSIFNQKALARTSKTPGRTQQINLFIMGNNLATVVDLPGYGYAKTSKAISENLYQLCYDYLHNRQPAKLFLLIDSRRGIMDIDTAVLEAIQVLNHRLCLVFTKSDLVRAEDLKNLTKTAIDNNLQYLIVSNRVKHGIIETRKVIVDTINGSQNKN